MLSDSAQSFIAILLISIPTIEFGGRFLQTQIGNPASIIKSSEQAAYFRAGHAHAGVLVILAIVAQIVADSVIVSPMVEMLLRGGFAAAPILMSAGFFLGAPMAERKKPGRLVILLYTGGIILALATVGLGIALLTT